jgi:hypothetical protein
VDLDAAFGGSSFGLEPDFRARERAGSNFPALPTDGPRMSVEAVRTVRRPDNPEATRPDAPPPRPPSPARIEPTRGSRQIQAQLATPSGAEIRRRLDAFHHAMGGPYRVGGRDVHVAAPFRMVGGDGQIGVSAASGKIARALGPDEYRKVARHVGEVVSGKGSPEALRRVTQALIESPAYASYATSPPERGIRQLMWDHGIGMDCSGYTHHAFLASRAAPSSRYGLGAAVTSGIQQPSAAVFRKVSPLEARAGDFVRLGPANNQHKVIVYDRHEPHAGSDLHRAIASKLGSAPTARIVVLEVDSSWGAGGKPEAGGVERRVWAYDDSTKRWATLVRGDSGAWHVFPSRSSGPYDHELIGIHRPRSER